MERSGRIRIFVPPSTLLGTAFLDIRTEVDTTFEGGMQGLAFHSDYSTNGFFYVYYTRDGGSDCSITGGYRYRGCIAGLQGRYIFGDYCSSKIRIVTQINPTTWTVSEWVDLSGNIFGFGEDENGELYVSQGGSISRFESPTSCEAASIFENGFEDP